MSLVKAKSETICILFGSAAPFVLREDRDGVFMLVDECYIHGIMDGETMKERDMESLSRDFQLIRKPQNEIILQFHCQIFGLLTSIHL